MSLGYFFGFLGMVTLKRMLNADNLEFKQLTAA